MTESIPFDHTWLEQYVVPNYGRLPVWPARGEGPYVWDEDGKRYLDFAGGVAVCPLGHAHPEVVAAISRQAATLIHISNWYCIRGQAELARLLVEDIMETPGKCFFCNSGAEANEGLIKLARKYGLARPHAVAGPRHEIITFSGSFHGRTFGAMSATAQEKIHGGFGPIVPGFVYVPFNDEQAVAAAVTQGTVAILLEPVQGESGVNAATPEFLRTVQRICHERDLLLLLDEVQCGLGRTGTLRGWNSILPGREIQPDAVSWAKSIGSGFPLGAFWIRDRALAAEDDRKLCDLLGLGTHGTTYGGSPLACAAGLATLRVILRDDLPAHAATLGTGIADTVSGWNHPLIREVRAFGMMIGFDLDAAALSKVADGKVPSIYLANLLLGAGLMVVPAGPHVVRWLPPLNITDEHVREALRVFRSTLDQIALAGGFSGPITKNPLIA